MSDIAEQVDTILHARISSAFLREFHKDYRENSGSWENKDLRRFWEALAAWRKTGRIHLNRGKSVPNIQSGTLQFPHRSKNVR